MRLGMMKGRLLGVFVRMHCVALRDVRVMGGLLE